MKCGPQDVPFLSVRSIHHLSTGGCPNPSTDLGSATAWNLTRISTAAAVLLNSAVRRSGGHGLPAEAARPRLGASAPAEVASADIAFAMLRPWSIVAWMYSSAARVVD